MSSLFSLILVVVGGYLAAHVAFGWLAHRFHIVSGAEYLVLGILLGPEVSGLLGASAVEGFAPFLTLALGWIGVLVGAQFYLPELIRIPAAQYRIAFAEAAFTLAMVTGAMVATLSLLFGLSWMAALLPAVAMAAIATASAPTGIALVARRLGRPGLIVRQLQLTAAIDALMAIIAFGLLLAIDHASPPTLPRAPTATEWAVIGIAIGIVGGALFHLFLGDERKIDRLFVSLAGAIILASGAAAYLRLSPLLPTMLIGMILINTSDSRMEIKRVLATVERPVYFVLLIFAGATWQPASEAWVIPVLLFLVTRAAVKVVGAALGAAANDALGVLGIGWGRALLGQGGLAVAIGLNYLMHDRSILENVVFTAAILSVLLTDVTSPRIVEAVVRSASERVAPGRTPPVGERAQRIASAEA